MSTLKRAGNYISDKIDRLLTAVFGTAGGLLLTQFPQFLSQYLQRLGGHIDEAVYSLKKYSVPGLAERANDLKSGFDSILDSSPFTKLPNFIIHSDWSVTSEALKNYTPGMTFDAQGLYYFAAGIIAGLLVYGLLKFLINKGLNAVLVKSGKSDSAGAARSGSTELF